MGEEFLNVGEEFLNVGEEFLNVGEEFSCGYLLISWGFLGQTTPHFVSSLSHTFFSTPHFYHLPYIIRDKKEGVSKLARPL